MTSADITNYLTKKGYDALLTREYGTNVDILIVFDKKNITIIKSNK